MSDRKILIESLAEVLKQQRAEIDEQLSSLDAAIKNVSGSHLLKSSAAEIIAGNIESLQLAADEVLLKKSRVLVEGKAMPDLIKAVLA